MAVTIEDVESRTLLQQFHDLYKKQQEQQTNIEQNASGLADEIQNRTTADYEITQDIAEIQERLDSLGNVFTLKGSVDTVADLPAENNNIGDVYYVIENSAGFVWIDDDGTERWEQLGLTVDLSNYATQDDLTDGLATKQNILTAGTNISIIGNTISAVQPDVSEFMENPMTSAGDLIYGGANGDPTSLPIGTAGQVLTVKANGLAPEWQNASGEHVYAHYITLNSSGITILIENNSNQLFSTSDLANWLYTNGFNSVANGYKISRVVFGTGTADHSIETYSSIYALNTTNITVRKSTKTPIVDNTNISFFNSTTSDISETIKSENVIQII